MSPLFWILVISWAFLGIAGAITFLFWTIVDADLQDKLSSRLRTIPVTTLSPISTALYATGLSMLVLAIGAVSGPVGLLYATDLLNNATTVRISRERGGR